MTYKEEALDFLGITKWHNVGYTGKGTRIMSDEKIYKKAPGEIAQERWDKIICPKGYRDKKGDTPWHGTSVMHHILLVAPDAECIAYPMSGFWSSASYNSPCIDYILANDVTVFTTSCLGSKVNTGKAKAMQSCIDNGCVFFAAAGNNGSAKKGESTIHGESKSEKYLAIGGVKPQFTGKYDGDEPIRDWTDIKKVTYSSEGEELDYVTLAEILGASGTSFCAPVFAGMIALVQQFFIENAGRKLKYDELIKFINDNTIDLEEKGFDIKTGYGLFILPDPDNIKISDYITDFDLGSNIDYSGFPEVRSDMVMRGIDKLHPELQKCVKTFLEECKKQNLDVLITETLRTQKEQEKLYAKGRTEPGKIVTNCRGYQSPHCWGVAFDFCRNKRGYEYDNTDNFFDKVGQIAKDLFKDTEYSLFWGGDFRTFVDKPHIEMKKYLPNNHTNWLIDNYGTPEEFMSTWEDMKTEGENYVHRYKTVEEMPEYAQEPIQELVDKGILAGKGGDLGLDLTEDMIRMLILAKKIFEQGV